MHPLLITQSLHVACARGDSCDIVRHTTPRRQLLLTWMRYNYSIVFDQCHAFSMR
jgi:hypothetical protein